MPWGTLRGLPTCGRSCAYFTYVYCLYLLDLAAVLSGGFQAFYADQGRHFASLPLCRCHRRHRRRRGDRLALEEDRKHKLARRSVAIVGLLGCAVFMVAPG